MLYTILTIVFYVLVVVVLWKVFRSILKVISIALLVLFIIIGGLSFLVYQDADVIESIYDDSEKLIIVENGDRIAFMAEDINFDVKEGEDMPFSVVPEDMINESEGTRITFHMDEFEPGNLSSEKREYLDESFEGIYNEDEKDLFMKFMAVNDIGSLTKAKGFVEAVRRDKIDTEPEIRVLKLDDYSARKILDNFVQKVKGYA
ncbi:MAG: hypothetical protein ACQEP1_06700 [Nanobdellota archaeon]